jgi:hypothetical protein
VSVELVRFRREEMQKSRRKGNELKEDEGDEEYKW